MSNDQPTIAVFGATGRQGGGVVRALVDAGGFRVRALTRHPERHADLADEVLPADLDRPETLAAAVAGAHGVFLVTNFWEPGTDEVAQARGAIEAARAAGVRHFIWSTLPDVEAISGGRFHVPHFTQKAHVDAIVRDAGFPFVTFVQAPFYFQNLAGSMAPRDLGNGERGWVLPLERDDRVVHMGAVGDVGLVAAGAFAQPEDAGDGAVLAVAGGLYSFGDVADTMHGATVRTVPAEVYAGFFPGADELAQMMLYWKAHTYMGPGAEPRIAHARRVATAPLTDLATWAAAHLEG